MKPTFSIIADDKDITSKIADRLISLTVTDEAGLQSDTVEIKIDNRDFAVALPRTGADLRIHMGYGTALRYMGLYKAEDVTLSGPPSSMTVRGNATFFSSTLKAPKSRSFDNVTIGGLVAKIASEHGYEPRVGQAMAGILLPHIDQTSESDMHLLTRLSIERGAVFKPVAGKLLFLGKEEETSATGKELPTIDIGHKELIGSWRYSANSRGRYTGVRARWRDLQANADVTVLVGEEGTVFELRNTYADEDTARSGAKSKLGSLLRGTASLDLTVVGNSAIKAEMTANISGLHPVIAEAPWKVTKAVHSLSGSGYKTSIEAESK